MNTKLLTNLGIVWVVFSALLAIVLITKKPMASKPVATAPVQVTLSAPRVAPSVVPARTSDRTRTTAEILGTGPSSVSTQTSLQVKK